MLTAKSMIVLASTFVFPTAALADATMVGPMYIGSRSANPEQETYGYLVRGVIPQQLAFVGPAHNVGLVSGNDEKDTIAYRAMLGVQTNELWSFSLALQ